MTDFASILKYFNELQNVHDYSVIDSATASFDKFQAQMSRTSYIDPFARSQTPPSV